MGVDNSKVHDYIQDALDKQTQGTTRQRLDAAWNEVNLKRASQCDNLNLTAADHYLISRWLIVSYSPAIATVYSWMILAYDGVYKAVNEIVKKAGDKDIVFKTGNCPASSFSPMVGAWAMTGIADGTTDFVSTKWQSSPKLNAPKSPQGVFGF